MHLAELLDLVGVAGKEPTAIDEAVRHLYDWHHSRGVVAMQLTFAPVAAGSLAIVAKPGSTVLVVTAICVVVISLLLGLAQLFLALNWLHREYAYAVRLAVKFGRFHEGLARYPHGFGAPASSDIRKLYDQLGTVSMVAYRSDSETRECVLRVISGMACDDD